MRKPVVALPSRSLGRAGDSVSILSVISRIVDFVFRRIILFCPLLTPKSSALG